MNTTALVFQNTTFDIVDRDGDAWLKSSQLAEALGYADERAINRIFARHADEFTDAMTATVKLTDRDTCGVNLTVQGQERETRIFSPRGCYAIAMFARTKTAKAFRVWVMDVLESIRKTGRYEAQPYAVNPGDTLSKEEADQIRRILNEATEKQPKEKQAAFARAGWSKLKSHFKVGYRKIPRQEFTEALSIATRHAIEGEYLPAAVNAENPAISEADHWKAYAEANCTSLSGTKNNLQKLAAEVMKGQRLEVIFASSEYYGGITPFFLPIKQDARVLTDEEFITHVGNGFPSGLIPALIQAVASRLTASLPKLAA